MLSTGTNNNRNFVRLITSFDINEVKSNPKLLKFLVDAYIRGFIHENKDIDEGRIQMTLQSFGLIFTLDNIRDRKAKVEFQARSGPNCEHSSQLRRTSS